MTTAEIDYLDGEISVQEEEPNTLDELKQIIGENGIVDETVSNLRYRNKYPRVYRKASKELETLVPRTVKETKTLKDGTQKQVLDSETNHLRECWKTDPKLTAETITKIAQSETLYVKGERVGGGGKISQAAMDAANSLFADGDDAVENAVGAIEGAVPGFKVGRDADENVTPESLARGIQALNRFLTKQTQAKTLQLIRKAT